MSEKVLIAKSATKEVHLVDGKHVIKNFGQFIPKADVLQEAINTARVESATDLNIPEVIAVGADENGWSITYEYIEGQTLAELMESNPANKMQYLEMMVDLQMQMHRMHCPHLLRMKERLTRQIQSLDSIDQVTKYEMLTRLDGMPRHTKLCHGDFEPRNIIVKGDKMYIIDWVHATQGNASGDIARTYLLLCLKDNAMAEAYIDMFCEKSGTDRAYVFKWLPVVAAAQLSKDKEEERELLLSWTDVVEYE